MIKKHSQSRRSFLKKLSIGVGSSSLLATQGKLQLMNAAIAADSDYSHFDDHKSLVCVFLLGGNDAFNTMIPYEQSAYQKYQAARTGMALSRNSLHALKGGEQAFHSSLPDLQQLYNDDKLAVATNIGAIIEPTTRQTFKNKSVQLPPDLFSHSHQQEFWETGTTAKNSVHPPGWGGRMIDMLASANSNPTEPSMFSLAGNSVWQKGIKSLDFVLNPYEGVTQIRSFTPDVWPNGSHKESRIAAWNRIKASSSSSLLQQHMTSTYNSTEERINSLIEQIAQAQEITTEYPSDNELAVELKMAAKMISIRENLGQKRQIFFVALGGWDTHGNQLADHAERLGKLNDALKSFYDTTVELGIADSVTTFTASEFGRTMSINGDGTDHAWAGHNIIMGDAVKGGQVHGDPINLTIDGPDDAQDTGRFIPKYGVDQYGSTLAKWMGMSDSDMNEIFPNLSNFDTNDLGFMS
ncbi:DUF1501 domain-containing protein [Cocleimonas sp. KMM 6892]|uniref:DUF1501 domain-containing protein n=1 Tax=unclassified Cocleimonas TaxID=2639732 RepID=UPI002DB82007|nr:MULTISPECIES: DUF1501 domain-containing protein [unclassified Cocleimonas]MEB8431635.1 DUF1501 domain-containing protein [Cocleimonas sp. KMM 6892]MEC4713593.1 DUF1501 domain-containing protein [Cocleimonas sp. KMM 6895]MEC4742924.1 DUF1501 domain-containing protein [Cocleimonas sp. KMM 6896]